MIRPRSTLLPRTEVFISLRSAKVDALRFALFIASMIVVTAGLGVVGGLTLAGCGQRNASAHVPPAPNSSGNSTARNSASQDSTATNGGSSSGNNSRAGSAGAGQNANGTGASVQVPPVTGSHVETGLASWYGVPYHGRRASDGEIYDMNKLTAAHRTLPFNTVVRVTNLANGQQVDVRIIDRGPFVEDRIIDLSLAAAQAINMVGSGTARVRVEILSGAPNPIAGRFAVQVGAFSDRANAERLREQLAVTYPSATVQEFTGPNGRLFRVRVGNEPNETAARQLGVKVQNETNMRTFVIRLDNVAKPDSTPPPASANPAASSVPQGDSLR